MRRVAVDRGACLRLADVRCGRKAFGASWGRQSPYAICGHLGGGSSGRCSSGTRCREQRGRDPGGGCRTSLRALGASVCGFGAGGGVWRVLEGQERAAWPRRWGAAPKPHHGSKGTSPVSGGSRSTRWRPKGWGLRWRRASSGQAALSLGRAHTAHRTYPARSCGTNLRAVGEKSLTVIAWGAPLFAGQSGSSLWTEADNG
jgi:hypothetical protein